MPANAEVETRLQSESTGPDLREDREALEDLFREDRIAGKRRRKRALIGALVCGAAAALCVQLFVTPSLGQVPALVLFTFTGVALTTYLSMLQGKLRWQILRLLRAARHRDVRAIPPLIEALHVQMQIGPIWVSGSVRSVVIALTSLLPRIGPAGALLLAEEHRATLRKVIAAAAISYPDLEYYFPPAFLEAVMSALVRLGDAGALGPIRSLAGISQESESHQQIARSALSAAEELEAVLRQRVNGQTHGRRRASEGRPVLNLLPPGAASPERDI